MIPALQQAAGVRVHGIASRELAKAQAVAEQFDLPRAYGDYESLLADPDIDVVYNPLPNHLHVPWTEKAARAGKHVLCEKPIALDAAEAASLIPVRDETGLQIQEAYVVIHHPQWQRVRELVREGRIGRLRAIQGWFSYWLDDPGTSATSGRWAAAGCSTSASIRWSPRASSSRRSRCVPSPPSNGTPNGTWTC